MGCYQSYVSHQGGWGGWSFSGFYSTGVEAEVVALHKAEDQSVVPPFSPSSDAQAAHTAVGANCIPVDRTPASLLVAKCVLKVASAKLGACVGGWVYPRAREAEAAAPLNMSDCTRFKLL